jgi:homoserine dehydrogenase
MTKSLRLGIAGLGTVGVGVIKIVQQNVALLSSRANTSVKVTAVCAQSRTKSRSVDISDYAWEDDPVKLAKRDDVDVYIELMGGEDDPAKASVEAAIAAGKHVVTANKALLAHHGHALACAAEDSGVSLRFEAAVAGGIPIIKALAEGLAGNKIQRIMGVMNGTCNYILTRMEHSGLTYSEIFEEANQLGFLEADPNLDVGGVDAAHKLVLLSAIAYGTQVNFDAAQLQGIGAISTDDITAAKDMGYRIKLLGLSQMTDQGLEQTMQPCLVPYHSPLGQLEGGTNMVVVEGDNAGQIVLCGAGAGEGPTASAVMSDVMDIARNISIPTFGIPAAQLTRAPAAQSTTPSAYYIRTSLRDAPGVLANTARALGDAGVSIDRLRQQNHEGDSAPLLIVTHPTKPSHIDRALSSIAATGETTNDPIALRIVEV